MSGDCKLFSQHLYWMNIVLYIHTKNSPLIFMHYFIMLISCEWADGWNNGIFFSCIQPLFRSFITGISENIILSENEVFLPQKQPFAEISVSKILENNFKFIFFQTIWSVLSWDDTANEIKKKSSFVFAVLCDVSIPPQIVPI